MKEITFIRDPRQFDGSEFYLGISILLYSEKHYIWGTISLILAIMLWLMYKIFSKVEKEQIKNDKD